MKAPQHQELGSVRDYRPCLQPESLPGCFTWANWQCFEPSLFISVHSSSVDAALSHSCSENMPSPAHVWPRLFLCTLNFICKFTSLAGNYWCKLTALNLKKKKKNNIYIFIKLWIAHSVCQTTNRTCLLLAELGQEGSPALSFPSCLHSCLYSRDF